ncbi:sec1 family domain-containing protein 2-like [Ascaphus truei]|uniref:sec1 family domain-containing protein 2-like n=1 Tax=Ascaphus truei TaxID=8439 RepID=UPI003F59B330
MRRTAFSSPAQHLLTAATAEILHWCSCTELLLLSAGALHVKEFSCFEAGAANQPKALFVVSCGAVPWTWCARNPSSAEVMWAPLLLAPISPHLFRAPAFLFLLLPGGDLQALNCSWPGKKRIPGLGDVELHSLPPELQLHIRSLVSGLNHLMEGIGVREECFSVGHMSTIIAGELASYPQARNRSAHTHTLTDLTD